jgi:hypothetical protein
MSKPRISDYTRRLWKRYPMARAGITSPTREQVAIRACLESGDTAGAQRIILARLRREIDGPRTVAAMRGGRKVLRAVATRDGARG